MNLSQDELLSQLRGMDEYEFEELVADVWEQRGWETTVTTGSNDRGIDVIAEKATPFSQKHLIQAKRYSAGNKIGSPDIQQYSSLRHQEDDVDAVVVVTTSSFSPQASQTANDLNVKLIDGEKLSEIILNLKSQRFLSDYFSRDTHSTGGVEKSQHTIDTIGEGSDSVNTKDDTEYSEALSSNNTAGTDDRATGTRGQYGDARRHQPVIDTSSTPPEPGTSVDILDADTPPEPGTSTKMSGNNTSGNGEGTLLLLWLISIVPTAILILVSIINFSLHNLLLPAGVVTLIMTVVFEFGWRKLSTENSSTENSPPRGLQ